MPCVCPWWLAYTFDHRGRRLFHKPEMMLGPYVEPGMTVLDVGCGMGYFSIPMAGMVGDTGRIISADLQQRMLDTLMKRARRAGVAGRIRPHRCEPDRIGVEERVDFALAAFVVHETPDPRAFLGQIRECLKPGGRLYVIEPRFEVSKQAFDATIETAGSAGLRLLERPAIRVSHAVVFEAV